MDDSQEDFERALERLTTLILSRESLDETLPRVLGLAVHGFQGCDSAGVSLRTDGRLKTAAAWDKTAETVDAHQHRLHQGPCIDAMETRSRQYCESLAGADRWPAFAPRAQRAGIQSILAYALLAGNQVVGSLNLYSKKERGFDEATIQIADSFAKRVAIVIYNALVVRNAYVLTEQLEAALDSRPLIDQAKGILMQRKRISADAAFDELRRESQKRNKKLREVAQELVDSVAQRKKS